MDQKCGFKYISTLAILMNVWRAFGKKIADVWTSHSRDNGRPSASETTGRVPPKCISGRWGKISECERFVRSVDARDLVAVLGTVLAPRTRGKASRVTTKDVDELRKDELAAFTEKMTKWSHAVVNAVADANFFRVMDIASLTREPLNHYYHSFLTRYDMKDPSGPSNMTRFVCNGADKIAEEMLALFKHPHWIDMVDDLPIEEVSEYT
eukprot:8815457-Pyramimonas_sp.AAC.1